MSSTEFRFDLDDAQFVLFEQFRMDEQVKTYGAYADFDADLYRATLGEAYKLARESLFPVNGPGDREGCHLSADGEVTTPKGYKDAYNALVEGGWNAPRADPELGGGGMPNAVVMMLTEIMCGANMALMMYPGLTSGAARVIVEHGPQDLRSKVAEKMFSGVWGGTMCLTEAGAGTAVGDNRAKATPTDQAGIYELEGEKIFISGGDQDLTENIVHLVLARTPGAPEGTKGLSLFMAPKFWFDDNLALGERNGAHVLRIEHKMGINGSATCVLGLGAKSPCKAWIVGEEGQGIQIMFQMMNEARIGVAVQGLATASAAYQYSRSYARERIQGTSTANFKNPSAKRVAIVEHPDVRRMLMHQKVCVETMRALICRLGLLLEHAELSEDEKQRKHCQGQADLLVPVAKALCTDLSFECVSLAVQVYGGYGYTQDFPVEQLLRDTRIQSIYEGTNGVQALDLLGRKMRQQNGALFMSWMQDAMKIIKVGRELGFESQAQVVDKCIKSVAASAMHLGNLGRERDMDGALLNAVPFLRAFGLTALGLEAMDQASIAKKAIDAGKDSTLYAGKLLNLDYMCARILPNAIALSKEIQSNDKSCLDPLLFAEG